MGLLHSVRRRVKKALAYHVAAYSKNAFWATRNFVGATDGDAGLFIFGISDAITTRFCEPPRGAPKGEGTRRGEKMRIKISTRQNGSRSVAAHLRSTWAAACGRYILPKQRRKIPSAESCTEKQLLNSKCLLLFSD